MENRIKGFEQSLLVKEKWLLISFYDIEVSVRDIPLKAKFF